MSDVFEGPGWWMASDAKWYAPHLHPDPDYRRRWAKKEPEQLGPPIVEDLSERVHVSVGAGAASRQLNGGVLLSPPPIPVAATRSRMPKAIVRPFNEDSPTVVDLSNETTIDLTVHEAHAEPAAVEPEADVEPEAAPEPEVDLEPALDLTAGLDLAPEFDLEPELDPAPAPEPEDVPAVRIEAERTTTNDYAAPRPVVSVAAPSTALVHVRPDKVYYDDPTTRWDRTVAAALFLAGITMIIGTFIDWSLAPARDLSGWEMGDGLATVFAGVLGSAAAGPIFVGFRHMVPKTIALISGLVGLVVAGLAGLRIISDDVLVGTELGPGFWVVIAGSVVMMLAAWADRSSITN